MKITMTLVENRETQHDGKPQVKLTFVPHLDSSVGFPSGKLTLFLSPTEFEKQFPRLRAGQLVWVEVAPSQ
jgi:hypothetical protein